jgi:DNA-binding SARP family transcriptional activator
VSPNRVVPTTTLIDALWPSAESAHDPINALQLRVSRLRRTLASIGAPARLLRDGAGYRLVVDAEAVDLHRFDTLIDGARRAEAPDVAVSRYDDALRLWRGEPLVDFAGEAWAAVEATRLTELRLSAVAERAERMIALGRYDEAVADLELNRPGSGWWGS